MHFPLLLVGWAFISFYYKFEIILILIIQSHLVSSDSLAMHLRIEYMYPVISAWQHGGKGEQPVVILQN